MILTLCHVTFNAPCREKIWFKGGLECGEDRGKVCVIVRSLYRLKSAGAAFRAVLAQLLQDLGYTSSKADPDVWMHKAVRTDGHKYHEMLSVYVDDILALGHHVTECIQEITEYFKAKDGSINHPKYTLELMSQRSKHLMGGKYGQLHHALMSKTLF
jgi:Reverse transcriptase (RNA-dependent DNA polymerase)